MTKYHDSVILDTIYSEIYLYSCTFTVFIGCSQFSKRQYSSLFRFYMFTKPVDTEEVPDYTKIIKQPMDLETMMTKVDFHRYECAKDFLSDIELIVQNALEYNPAR